MWKHFKVFLNGHLINCNFLFLLLLNVRECSFTAILGEISNMSIVLLFSEEHYSRKLFF